MSKKDKILQKARRSPENLTFDELCSLAEHFGFVFRNQRGSHKIFKHPGIREVFNIQDHDGKAKKYQVKQLLEFIDNYNLKN